MGRIGTKSRLKQCVNKSCYLCNASFKCCKTSCIWPKRLSCNRERKCTDREKKFSAPRTSARLAAKRKRETLMVARLTPVVRTHQAQAPARTFRLMASMMEAKCRERRD